MSISGPSCTHMGGHLPCQGNQAHFMSCMHSRWLQRVAVPVFDEKIYLGGRGKVVDWLLPYIELLVVRKQNKWEKTCTHKHSLQIIGGCGSFHLWYPMKKGRTSRGACVLWGSGPGRGFWGPGTLFISLSSSIPWESRQSRLIGSEASQWEMCSRDEIDEMSWTVTKRRTGDSGSS